MPFGIRTLFALILCASVPVQGFAQDDARFELELNDAQAGASGGCRLVYVARNASQIALDQAEYEVAVFNADNVVTKLLILKFGDFAPDDTKVAQFEIGDLACDAISSIVVNRMVSCTETGTNASVPLCKAGLTTRSLSTIRFYD